MNAISDDEYLRAWIASRSLKQRIEDVKENIRDSQHWALCGLFRYPSLAAQVTPHLFAGSPASVCIVKAIKGGARGLEEIIRGAAKIARVPMLKFPVVDAVDIALGPSGSRAGAECRIAELKFWVRELARLEKISRRRLAA